MKLVLIGKDLVPGIYSRNQYLPYHVPFSILLYQEIHSQIEVRLLEEI